MKVGILCGRTLDKFETGVLEPFLNSSRHEVSVCFIDNRPQRSALRRLAYNIRKGRGAYIFIMTLNSLFEPKKGSHAAEILLAQNKVPVFNVDRLYSEDTIKRIADYHLDIIVVLNGWGMIKEPILSMTRNGVLSYHHGNMRKYRGQPYGFWEIFNGEKEMGVTVQRLNAGLDCGIPIVEKNLSIKHSESLGSLKQRALVESAPMMLQAIDLLDDGYIPKEITEFGKIYTIPNFGQWLLFHIKYLFRRLKHLQEEKHALFHE